MGEGEGIVQVHQEVLEVILRGSRKWESHDFHLLLGSVPHIWTQPMQGIMREVEITSNDLLCGFHIVET